MVASWLSGMPLREAAGLGTLMNTRGLMELVILNIGLDIKIISPALFSMMVIMALVTTFMTTPVLELICPQRLLRASSESTDDDIDSERLGIEAHRGPLPSGSDCPPEVAGVPLVSHR